MAFKSVFIAVFIGTALLVGAMMVHERRPMVERGQPSAEFVRATGKCAECHLRETSAVVHQFEMSRHAALGLSCIDCHMPAEGQEPYDHRGFTMARTMTAANCRACHPTQYDQFVRSRHGAPAWAALTGAADFTAEQVAFAERHHPGAVKRPANALAALEGPGAINKGCAVCHSVGKPNADGSIGTCTHCHSRHNTSIRLARTPATCGQCHMGPDHSQIEIYNESKHGVLFAAQGAQMNLDARPQNLTTRDMPVPTCATCHMSGLEGMKVTHDVGERLSYWLFAEVSERRPHYQQAQTEMKELCLKCHTKPNIERFYAEAEVVVEATNAKVSAARAAIDGLYADGLLTKKPFDEPIEFVYFDLWHYFGRTAKHGAFMGGADFVQWHGNYELLLKAREIDYMAAELRRGHGPTPAPPGAQAPASP